MFGPEATPFANLYPCTSRRDLRLDIEGDHRWLWKKRRPNRGYEWLASLAFWNRLVPRQTIPSWDS